MHVDIIIYIYICISTCVITFLFSVFMYVCIAICLSV